MSLPSFDSSQSDDDSVPELPDLRPVVLITTVDIGNGESDRIVIRRGDDPADVARDFVRRHGLDAAVLAPLSHHLREHLQRAKNDLKTAQPPPPASQRAEASSDRSSSADSPCQVPPPMHQDSPVLPTRDSSNTPPVCASSASPGDAPGMTFDERLSAKMVPVSQSQMVSLVSAADVGRPRSAQLGHAPRSREHSPRDSVHMRLYGLAADKARRLQEQREVKASDAGRGEGQQSKLRMSWVSEAMMRDRTAGPYGNYGQMLYNEGVEVAAMRRARAEAELAERRGHELDGVTFRPAITAMAARLEMEPAWQRLSSGMRKQTLEQLEEMRRAQEEAQIQECSFQPAINKQSVMMMEERGEALRALQLTPHEHLYQDATRRQEKLAALSHQYPEGATFHPVVNRSSAAMQYLQRSWERCGLSASAGGPGGSDPGATGVVDRLYALQEKYKSRMDDAREKYQGPVDPVTGRQLYTPEINRSSPNTAAAHRNKEGKPIGEYLYSVAQEQASRKAAVADLEARQAAHEASKSHATSTSHRLFRALKLKRFRQIFEYLSDSPATAEASMDLVGLVRCPTDRLDNLDPEVRADVELAADVWAHQHGTSLCVEGGLGGASAADMLNCPVISFEHFVKAMEEALHVRRKPRSYLVTSPSGKSEPSYSFHPKIDRHSKALAESRLRPAECTGAKLGALLYKTAEQTREKLDSKRREAEEAALAGCTFVPQLNVSRNNPYRHVVEGRALAMAGGRPWSGMHNMTSSTSIAGSARGGGGGSPRVRYADSSVADAALEDATFEAMEQEVAAMEERSRSGNGDEDGGAEAQSGSPYSGALVAPEDMAATEQLLLELLSGGHGPEGFTLSQGAEGLDRLSDTALSQESVGRLLQRFLDHKGQLAELAVDDGSATPGGAAATAHYSRMAGGKAAATGTGVSVFVMPDFDSAAVGGGGARDLEVDGGGVTGVEEGLAAMLLMGQSLQDLASDLGAWDHVADPGMATVA